MNWKNPISRGGLIERSVLFQTASTAWIVALFSICRRQDCISYISSVNSSSLSAIYYKATPIPASTVIQQTTTSSPRGELEYSRQYVLGYPRCLSRVQVT